MKECLPDEDPGSWERDGNLSFKKKKNARMEQILFQWMQFYSGVPKLNLTCLEAVKTESRECQTSGEGGHEL